MTSALLTAPLDLLDSLQDHERWKTAGVTHWHCHAEEQPININSRPNDARFNTDRIRDLMNRDFVHVAHSPREALDWLIEQWTGAVNDPRKCPDPSSVMKQRLWHTDDLWHQQITHSWETLTTTRAIPAGCGLQIRPGLSLDAFCYPMTSARCRRHT